MSRRTDPLDFESPHWVLSRGFAISAVRPPLTCGGCHEVMVPGERGAFARWCRRGVGIPVHEAGGCLYELPQPDETKGSK